MTGMNHGDHRGSQQVEDLVHEIFDRTMHNGRSFHFLSFFAGVAIIAAILGLLRFLLRNGISREARRRRLGETLQRLSALDAEGARKLFGDVGLPSWLGQSDDEHVNWANAFFGQLWAAQLGRVLDKFCADMIQPILDASKPAWMGSIRLVKFDLGEIPPRINSVQVHHKPRRDSKGRAQEIIMEMNFEWKGDQDMELMVKPLPRKLGPATFLLQGLSTFIKLRVGLEDFYLSGRIRVTMRPLNETLPCISALQVSFVGMPRYSFELRVYGGNVRMLPGVQLYLNQLVRDNLKPYILPEKMIFPVMEQGDNDILDPPRGVVVVKVLEAAHLPKRDLLGLTDPFVRISVSEHMQQKTEVRKRTLHPKWDDEEILLVVHEPKFQEITAIVFDWDRFSPDQPFCKCTIPIKDLPESQPQDLWLDLHDPEDMDVPVRHPVPGVAMGKKLIDTAASPVTKAISRNRKPQLHLEVTYQEFDVEEVKQAMEDSRAGRLPDPNTPAGQTARILHGGLLTVGIKQARYLPPTSVFKLGFASSMRVELEVAGQTKKTGSSNRLSPMFNEDIEFVLDGPASQNAKLKVQVWDRQWIDDLKGEVEISLDALKREKRILTTWQLRGTEDKIGPGLPLPEIEMDLRWAGFLDVPT